MQEDEKDGTSGRMEVREGEQEMLRTEREWQQSSLGVSGARFTPVSFLAYSACGGVPASVSLSPSPLSRYPPSHLLPLSPPSCVFLTTLICYYVLFPHYPIWQPIAPAEHHERRPQRLFRKPWLCRKMICAATVLTSASCCRSVCVNLC
jgi:hypothetical protein